MGCSDDDDDEDEDKEEGDEDGDGEEEFDGDDCGEGSCTLGERSGEATSTEDEEVEGR